MEFHVGRLLDHVHVRVADLARSKRFYLAVLNALGRRLTLEGDTYFASDELFVSSDGKPSQVHLAFQADGPEAVGRFYHAGLAAGYALFLAHAFDRDPWLSILLGPDDYSMKSRRWP